MATPGRIPLNEVVTFDVVTHDPTTGGISDADSPPFYDVFEDDNDTPILETETLTKRASLTGNYRGQFIASAANGFEVGLWYNVVATATVNSITGKTVVMTFTVVPAEASAGVPAVDVTFIGGNSAAASKLQLLALSFVTGVADSGSTTTMVDAARNEADVDYWKGAMLCFNGGDLLGQCRLITGFNPATDTITFFPATTQPVSVHPYIIIPAAAVNLSATAVQDIWAEVLEDVLTARGIMRVLLASAAGASTPAGDGDLTIAYKDPSGTVERIDAMVDASGFRSAVTLDVSDP